MFNGFVFNGAELNGILAATAPPPPPPPEAEQTVWPPPPQILAADALSPKISKSRRRGGTFRQ